MGETSTRTAERAMALLGVVCEHGAITLAESARETGLAASTALRLLRALENGGFVRREADGSFRPGTRIVQFGARALSHESLVPYCREAMERIVAVTRESVYLSIPSHDDTALYIAITEGTHSVRHTSWVGRTIPRRASAVGAVFAGETPARGYVVVEDGVENDVTAIAAPLLTGSRVIAALSVVVPDYRLRGDKVVRIGVRLAGEAHDLSRSLGGQLPPPAQPAQPTYGTVTERMS
ncbi:MULTISPECIES: IclR family transcriptional regulator [Streptomyces]|uniref:IclR family transcriptional regulator n=1 Tax=Streptomyces TaxID=1883 RepID=UPI000F51000A|nr:helix-turn-helix domain-containing protein [Streptomyces sp. TUS-ST3]GLP67109.1 IclR family transcriptional regulator [Streptomyces sp. TUS-ST3]